MKKMTWKHKVAFGAMLAIPARRLLLDILELPEAPWVTVVISGWWTPAFALISFIFMYLAVFPELKGRKGNAPTWAGSVLCTLCILLMMLCQVINPNLPYLWLFIPCLAGGLLMFWGGRRQKKARQAEAEAAAREQDKSEK